ncbi:MAG: hypothetical protein RLO08_07865 [Parvibaculaceae bacterium]
MRIGIDFDNTIACYEGVFHRAAVERELIPETLGTDKNTVRNYLREQGREDDWTELQGYVYGARMDMVALYDGFTAFVDEARSQGHDLLIISHKTKAPFMGPAYDLHASARKFLEETGILCADKVPEVYFELTLEEKVARIAGENCDCFVDDLPELLGHEDFPDRVRGILFDPHNHHGESPFERQSSWRAIAHALLG